MQELNLSKFTRIKFIDYRKTVEIQNQVEYTQASGNARLQLIG